MSKNNNVNSDPYKTGGREREGEAIVQKEQKTRVASVQHDLSSGAAQRQRTLQRKASAVREKAGAKKPLFEGEGAWEERTRASADARSGPATKASTRTVEPHAPAEKEGNKRPAAGRARVRGAVSTVKTGAAKSARPVAKTAGTAAKRARSAARGPRQSLPKRPTARKK